MLHRFAQIYLLLGPRGRGWLAATTAFVAFERLAWSGAVLGLTVRPTAVWLAGGLGALLWAAQGASRQMLTTELRRKLTIAVAETSLAHAHDPSFLTGEQAEIAVLEGRHAAEQVLLRYLPSLVAEVTATLALAGLVHPADPMMYSALAGVGLAAILLTALRKLAASALESAWGQYIEVADAVLTASRASAELVASGHDDTYVDRVRAKVLAWTQMAARAERRAALFQRLPLAAIAVVAFFVVLHSRSLDLDRAVRVGVFFPPLAALTRTIFELLRMGPRIETLGPILDAEGAPAKHAGDLVVSSPCEVRFESVTFSYGGVPLIDNLSFTWTPGQILAIYGPNGSGKSTLLRLLIGLIEPTSGRILVDGVDLRQVDLRHWRRGLGYLPQQPHVPSKATVRDLLQLVNPDTTDDQAESALKRVEMWTRLSVISPNTHPLDALPSRLSGGERKRILLARTIVRNASMLLLDEPDDALDASSRTALIDLLAVQRGPRMIACATHDEALLRRADCTIWLGRGEAGQARTAAG